MSKLHTENTEEINFKVSLYLRQPQKQFFSPRTNVLF